MNIDGEEIVTTPAHPFYVKEKGFILAGDLLEGSILVDSEGNELHLKIKRWEHLQNPVPVYNFAVEDYHTYFVGNNEVLVHNRCQLGENMIKNGMGDPGKGFDAHHIFPQKFRQQFAKIGIDVDDAKFGMWLEEHIHRRNSYSYNKMWEDFFNQHRNVSNEILEQEFLKFVQQLDRLW